jgi:3-hexulose-6-phosphate synthase
MKLQLALDRLTVSEAIKIADQVKAEVDWIEVGTSLIKEYGMSSVKALREAFPDHIIVADMKTFDNALYEMEICFAAGADLATVMGAAPVETIELCLNAAKRFGKEIMIDLLETPTQKIEALERLGNAIFCTHISKDRQERKGVSQTVSNFSADRAAVKGKKIRWAVAGGINEALLPDIVKENPEVVIVGSAITKAANPGEAARRLKSLAQGGKGFE